MNRLLAFFASGYAAASALRREAYNRGWFRARRLKHPVISVGNLALGGTGKTPLVAYIAKALSERGWKPSILTRGYGRRRGEALVVIEPGAGCAPDSRLVGDEPAFLARSLPDTPIVVCADRYTGGCLAEGHFGVDLHILDDGFQHWALERDVDVVALDSAEEPSARRVLPAGRWREPLPALARADLIVLTRAELGDPAPFEAELRTLDLQAQVFRSSTRLDRLIDLQSGLTFSAESWRGKPLGAFCGIGNPRAFFRNLRQWGLLIASEQIFRDHHMYSPRDLRTLRLALERSQAAALITTEKDAMNLPTLTDSREPILACVTRTELDQPEAFLDFLIQRLESARVREPARNLNNEFGRGRAT